MRTVAVALATRPLTAVAFGQPEKRLYRGRGIPTTRLPSLCSPHPCSSPSLPAPDPDRAEPNSYIGPRVSSLSRTHTSQTNHGCHHVRLGWQAALPATSQSLLTAVLSVGDDGHGWGEDGTSVCG